MNKEDWNKQYREGRWDYLISLKEASNNLVVAMYCNHFCPRAEILDVGCGFGNITEHIQFKDYLGIDFSEAVIERAVKKDRASFLCASAEDFSTDKKFDIIIFNEVLYYLDALEILKKYRLFLKENGFFVISIWKHPKTLKLWEKIGMVYICLDSIEISRDKTCDGWKIGVFR